MTCAEAHALVRQESHRRSCLILFVYGDVHAHAIVSVCTEQNSLNLAQVPDLRHDIKVINFDCNLWYLIESFSLILDF